MLGVGFFIGMFVTSAVIALFNHFKATAPIAPASVEPNFVPQSGNVIPFRSTRLDVQGLKLSVQATNRPTTGG